MGRLREVKSVSEGRMWEWRVEVRERCKEGMKVMGEGKRECGKNLVRMENK